MDCKKIQELIITDYLDNEMNNKLVERHIESCDDCRKFLILTQKTIVDPLSKAKKDHLSRELIWARLQEERLKHPW